MTEILLFVLLIFIVVQVVIDCLLLDEIKHEKKLREINDNYLKAIHDIYHN